MKILYVVDDLQDLVSDPLYVGLVRLLGQEQVVDFPSKAIFHEPSSKRWFLPQVPALPYDEAGIKDMLRHRRFDLICLASARDGCVKNLRRIYVASHSPPVVFIDGSDDQRIRREVAREFSVVLYFKREYAWVGESGAARWWDCVRAFGGDRALYECTHPLQISLPQDVLTTPPQSSNKSIDISFYGHASHFRRPQVAALIERLGNEGLKVAAGIYGSPTDRQYKLEPTRWRRMIAKVLQAGPVSLEDQQRKLSPAEYYDVLGRSKIAVSVRGGGFDTLRYWEIPARGSFLLSERPDIRIPENFEHRRQAVFFNPNLRDFNELVRYYVAHDAERETVAEAGHAHFLRYHSSERRAAYFVDLCAKLA
jgi:hypothetical protein